MFDRALPLALVVGLLAGFTLQAGPFTTTTTPDSAYLAGTHYIDLSAIPNRTNVTSITDGTQTVSFYADTSMRTAWRMNRREIGNGWATWSVAPDSQRVPGDALPVLWSRGGTSVFMALSAPALVFGFEAEPNPFGTFTMSARFYDSTMALLGVVSRDVYGNAGARLFAASADPIGFVEFGSTVDFAAGAFRYDTTGYNVQDLPEPAAIALVGLGLIALGLRRWSRR